MAESKATVPHFQVQTEVVMDRALRLGERVHIGVDVAAEDALIVSTVFDADIKTLTEIATDMRRLAARVRSGEIMPPELSGATFTVSNLGMYGMTAITPVINPPQAAILGVGAIRDTLAREADRVADRSLFKLTGCCVNPAPRPVIIKL